MAGGSSNLGKIRCTRRAQGSAAVLAIGTANPVNHVSQEEFPDYYFRVTKSEHLTDHKDTFKTICGAIGTENRSFQYTEEQLNSYPDFLLQHTLPSLEVWPDIVASAALQLAASAAKKAIAKWGRPATDITHLVVSTNSDASAPGIDVHLVSLLGLRLNICRTMLQLNGCFAGSSALRLAKDLAENNRGARVLVVCVELSIAGFCGPDDHLDTLIIHALFGDGAGVVIVGADTMHPVEQPMFEMVSASQTIIPGTQHVLGVKMGSYGVGGKVSTELYKLVADNIEPCLSEAFGPLDMGAQWNDLFWAVHPGARGILDGIDKKLQLEPTKLAASRSVLRNFGNMFSATIIFVLDELRRRMEEEGERAEWGVMLGFGPGFTIETMVLHATGALNKN
ncbi:bisdemethoxycurcumin synthase-like [Triticum urartu]|uniref:Curcuminoid synthase n=1 Tax=Triticum urartu TaxID=4572 RepID=A0A8R7P922_TRIUA|nr:bisdemethoxycurcumin synthase-like [Triticum urartu]